MGATQSRSQLERRNTMVRRSQRKSIHHVRTKLDKIYIDIKKFRGVEEDEYFENILDQLDRLRIELNRKVRDLQPQVKNYYQATLRRIDEAEEALEDQLEDNREYHRELKETNGKLPRHRSNPNIRRSRSRTLEESDEDTDEYDEEQPDKNVEQKEDDTEKETEKKKTRSLGFKRRFFKRGEDNDEGGDSETGTTQEQKEKEKTKGGFKRRFFKRKDESESEEDKKDDTTLSNGYDETIEELDEDPESKKPVELKFVKILTPEESIASDGTLNKTKSPDDKRKSILKVGIPVMPDNLVNELVKKTQRLSVHYPDEEDEETKVDNIVKQLEATEYEIAGFVGKKHSKHYNRIKDKLNACLGELIQFSTPDETIKEKIVRAKAYVGSCQAFLNEKAVENQEDSDNDVFLSGSRPLSPIEAQERFKRISKTTAI